MQDIRLRLDLLRRSFVDDMTVIDDVDAACQSERRREILLDQNNGLTGRSEIAAGLDQIAHDHRREPFERLIEKNDFRIANQRTRDGEHLLFATG